MTLSQFRTRISAVIGLDTTNAGTEQTLVDAWLNEAVVDFLLQTKIHKRLFSMNMTAGETEYTLATGILSLEKLWVSPVDGSQQRALEPISSADFFQFRMSEAVQSGPRFYTLEGAHLLLVYPAPASSSDTLQGIYVPRPAAISATAGTPSATANGGIPEEYHPVLESYVKWKAADFDDDNSSQAGLQYQAEYERGVAMTRSKLNMKAGVFQTPARWGRRRSRTRTPGQDLGG